LLAGLHAAGDVQQIQQISRPEQQTSDTRRPAVKDRDRTDKVTGFPSA
jgi:hypothetical protein